MTTTSAATDLPVVTVPVVRAYVRWLEAERQATRVVGILAQPKWTGPNPLVVDGATVHIRPCVSALAVREALLEHAERGEGYLVVITDVDDLGRGITGHLAKGRLLPVQLWQAVKDAFSARDLDPLLVNTDRSWAPKALVDHEPAGGWPAAPSGILTRNFALGHLARALLCHDRDGAPYIDAEHPDAEGLMRWSSDSTAVGRWLELPAEVRDGLSRWLEHRTGPAGVWTLRAVATGHARDAVALGIVAGLLWHDAADATTAGVAQGMFRSRLGGADLGYGDARTWARTAASYVSSGVAATDTAAVTALHRAEEMLGEFGARDLVKHSDQLEGAFSYRLRVFAGALKGVLPSPAPAALERVENVYSNLQLHELSAQHPRADTAAMALRLLRWLAASPRVGTKADKVDTLADAFDRQVRVDAWVDRAFADIWTGDPDPEVGSAYRALAEQVAERRSAHDEQLARLVATVTGDDADLGRIVPVENLLSAVVRPLAAERPVLLLVVDGMSTGVMTEVAEELRRSRRWVELVDGDVGARQAVLPAFPTLTGVSRTSLLTGKLQRGTAANERTGFPAVIGEASRIFHKGDLRTPAGDALAPDVRDAVRDPAVRVVAIVLNTVDDTLDKLDPGSTPWGVDAIQHLDPVLDVAREAERVVVLTSDHGHVVERGSEHRGIPGAGARWRPASSGPPGDGEVAVRGRRVLLGDGAVVLPWREGIRYVPKAGGYHGGVSAAEASIPLTVHVSGAVEELAGWVPAPPPEPPWWHSPLAPARPTLTEARPTPPATKRAEPAPTLFDEPEPEPTPRADPTASLVDALLASDVYAAQRKRASRGAPDDTRVRAIVEALLRNGGRLHASTLASAAQIPVTRMPTVLTAVRRLLAVDGYGTLSVDPDGVTYVLDIRLLREQFGLGDAP